MRTLVMLCALTYPHAAALAAVVDAVALTAVGREEEARARLSRYSREVPDESHDRLAPYAHILDHLGPLDTCRSVFASRGDEYFNSLGLSRPVQLALGTRITPQNLTARSTRLLIETLNLPSEPVRTAIQDALVELSRSRDENAAARLRLAAGQSVPASHRPEAFAEAVESGANSEWLLPLRVLEDAELEHVLSSTFALTRRPVGRC